MNFIYELLFGEDETRTAEFKTWKVGNIKMAGFVNDKNKIVSNIRCDTYDENHSILAVLKPCNLVTTKYGTFLVGYKNGGVLIEKSEIKIV